jgi:hypothetical protein
VLTKLSVKVADTDNHCADERQRYLERHALRLSAAWSDFDNAEQSAAEIVRRFGSIEPRDLGLMRLHREPVFIALQTACVVTYRRPFAAGNGIERIAARYAVYSKPEWQELHERLFTWAARLSGDTDVSTRHFVVARDRLSKDPIERYIVGEASPILEPAKHFTMLRDMCADRKAMLWVDVQDAISKCYPSLHYPTLLSLGGIAATDDAPA